MNSLIAHAKTLVCKRLKTPIFPIPKAQGGGLLLAPNRWSLCLRRRSGPLLTTCRPSLETSISKSGARVCEKHVILASPSGLSAFLRSQQLKYPYSPGFLALGNGKQKELQ